MTRSTRTLTDYKETVLSARNVLPIAVEMEELFPACDHFITHYGFDDKSKTWNTVVYFGGRYEIAMQVDVKIDYKNNQVTEVVGIPQFYLNELQSATILSDGRVQAFYQGENSRRFGVAEWKEIHEKKGDLSPLGIRMNPEAVEHFDAYVSGARRDIAHVSLLNKK